MTDTVDRSQLKQLRQHIRALRRSLSVIEQQQHSLAAATHLLTLPVWQRHGLAVGVTSSFDGELDLTPMINALMQQHCLYLPCLRADLHLEFAAWNANDPMRPNHLGIPEPLNDQRVAIDALDVVLVPLVAIDCAGNRLGMGGGYYDRSLGSVQRRPYLIGVAHSCQQVQQLPVQPWDIPLDALVTETGVTVWHNDKTQGV